MGGTDCAFGCFIKFGFDGDDGEGDIGALEVDAVEAGCSVSYGWPLWGSSDDLADENEGCDCSVYYALFEGLYFGSGAEDVVCGAWSAAAAESSSADDADSEFIDDGVG